MALGFRGTMRAVSGGFFINNRPKGVAIVNTIHDYNQLTNAMKTRKQFEFIDNCLISHQGIITSIQAEDDSATKWHVTLHTGQKIFVRTK